MKGKPVIKVTPWRQKDITCAEPNASPNTFNTLCFLSETLYLWNIWGLKFGSILLKWNSSLWMEHPCIEECCIYISICRSISCHSWSTRSGYQSTARNKYNLNTTICTSYGAFGLIPFIFSNQNFHVHLNHTTFIHNIFSNCCFPPFFPTVCCKPRASICNKKI